MKALVKSLAMISAVLFIAGIANAQCVGLAGGIQVCNLSVAPSSILGDESDFASATVTVLIPAGNAGGGTYIQFNGISVTKMSCSAGPVVST